MNKPQRYVFLGTAFTLASMFLHPPFHLIMQSSKLNRGYSFSPPIDARSTIDISTLAAQWIGVIFLGIMLYWYFGQSEVNESDRPAPELKGPEEEPSKSASRQLKNRLYLMLGNLNGYQRLAVVLAVMWAICIASIAVYEYTYGKEFGWFVQSYSILWDGDTEETKYVATLTPRLVGVMTLPVIIFAAYLICVKILSWIPVGFPLARVGAESKQAGGLVQRASSPEKQFRHRSLWAFQSAFLISAAIAALIFFGVQSTVFSNVFAPFTEGAAPVPAKSNRVTDAVLLAQLNSPDPLDEVPTIPLTAIKYQTRVGNFFVDMPKDYMALSKTDPAYFQTFAHRVTNLEVVEVFVTESDRDLGKSGELLDDQIVQLHIFLPGEPLIDDDFWEELMRVLPDQLSGSEAKNALRGGVKPALLKLNESSGGTTIADMNFGDVAVYQSSQRDVRWLVKSEIVINSSGADRTVQSLLISAALRVGSHAYLLQSVKQISASTDTLAAVRDFDSWVAATYAEPN